MINLRGLCIQYAKLTLSILYGVDSSIHCIGMTKSFVGMKGLNKGTSPKCFVSIVLWLHLSLTNICVYTELFVVTVCFGFNGSKFIGKFF